VYASLDGNSGGEEAEAGVEVVPQRLCWEQVEEELYLSRKLKGGPQRVYLFALGVREERSCSTLWYPRGMAAAEPFLPLLPSLAALCCIDSAELHRSR